MGRSRQGWRGLSSKGHGHPQSMGVRQSTEKHTSEVVSKRQQRCEWTSERDNPGVKYSVSASCYSPVPLCSPSLTLSLGVPKLYHPAPAAPLDKRSPIKSMKLFFPSELTSKRLLWDSQAIQHLMILHYPASLSSEWAGRSLGREWMKAGRRVAQEKGADYQRCSHIQALVTGSSAIPKNEGSPNYSPAW